MFTLGYTATDTEALPRGALPETFGKPSGVPAGVDRFSGGPLESQSIYPCVGDSWSWMPPLSEMQGAASGNCVLDSEDDLLWLGIAQLDTANVTCTNAIKSIVAANSETRSIAQRAALAIAGIGFAGCSKTAPHFNWLNPLDFTGELVRA